MLKAISISFLFFSIHFIGNTQALKPDSLKTKFEIQIPYSFNSPQSDLKDRFGVHSELGLNFNVEKGNLHWVNSFNFLFGGNVKDSLLFPSLANDQNLIISSENIFGDVRVYERGYNAFTGLAYNIWQNDYLSLRIQGQIGYLNYKTRIEVIDNNIPALNDDYKRGYDDMMHGLAFREFIGLYYSGDRSLANFFIGAQFTHSNTQSVRNYSYRSLGTFTSKSNDQYWGLTAGWILKIGERSTNRYYY